MRHSGALLGDFSGLGFIDMLDGLNTVKLSDASVTHANGLMCSASC